MIRHGLTIVFMGLFALLLVRTAISHPDDPKEKDRQPRWEGPAYRRSIDGLNPPGPGFQFANVTLMSWLPLNQFGNHSRGNDCWGYVSASGREYAIMGLQRGTGFVEITDPGNAQIISVHDGPSSTWRDIKVYGDYAYAVSEGGSGIQVFGLSQIDQGTVTLVRTVTTGGSTSTHNVALDPDSGFLYRCGGSGNGLRIYDLSDPSNPEFVASYSERYVHDAQVVTFKSGPYAGRQIAFCCGGFNGGWAQTGLTVIDVTNKANLQVLTHYQYPNGEYSHQGWLSEDRRYFYLDDELDESERNINTTTHVIDVSDITNPVQVATFSSGSPAIDHNQFVRGSLIFQANYRSGLRVFEASDPVRPVHIAYFDTYPTDDNKNFNGLWSNYPFFPSGTVIGSDIERGLFVWRLDLQATLADLSVLDGTIIAGGLPQIRTADNQHLVIEARVTGEAHQPHLMRLRLGAQSQVRRPAALEITTEGRITDVDAITTLYLRNWNNGNFVQVDEFNVGMQEASHSSHVPNASRFVRASDGRVELEMKQIVILPFTLNGFHSLIDLVSISAQ